MALSSLSYWRWKHGYVLRGFVMYVVMAIVSIWWFLVFRYSVTFLRTLTGPRRELESPECVIQFLYLRIRPFLGRHLSIVLLLAQEGLHGMGAHYKARFFASR